MERIRPNSSSSSQQSQQPSAPRPPAARGQSTASKLLVGSLVVVGLVIFAVILYVIFQGFFGGKIKDNQYQAVFLTNGQVYFGRLSNIDSDYVTLRDIYYLQVTQTAAENALQDEQGNQAAEQNISLAKLGNELHAPEDEMFISSDQILFWENIKNDGQVTQAIQEYIESGGEANQTNPNSSLNPGSTNGGASSTAPAGSDEANQSDTPGADGTTSDPIAQ